MKSMSALGNNVRLLTWEPEAKAKRLEAHWTLLLILYCIATGNYGKGCNAHGGVWVGGVVFAGSGGSGIGRMDGRCSVRLAKN